MEVPTESLDKSLLEFNNLLSPANLLEYYDGPLCLYALVALASVVWIMCHQWNGYTFPPNKE